MRICFLCNTTHLDIMGDFKKHIRESGTLLVDQGRENDRAFRKNI